MFTDAFISELAAAVAEKVIDKVWEEHGLLQQRLFDVQQAAQYLGRTPKAVEHLITRGVIQVTKLDGKRQIDRAALDKLIESNTYYET